MPLRERILVLIGQEPWLSATQIARRLDAGAPSVASILAGLAEPDGPLVREKGRGPRGGYGYAFKERQELPKGEAEIGPRKSRYELLGTDDWLAPGVPTKEP